MYAGYGGANYYIPAKAFDPFMDNCLMLEDEKLSEDQKLPEPIHVKQPENVRLDGNISIKNKASGTFMCPSHGGKFQPCLAIKPPSGAYGLFLRQKGDKIQIGGPNYYNSGGTQFAVDEFILSQDQIIETHFT